MSALSVAGFALGVEILQRAVCELHDPFSREVARVSRLVAVHDVDIPSQVIGRH
jgi:hypothetical protein